MHLAHHDLESLIIIITVVGVKVKVVMCSGARLPAWPMPAGGCAAASQVPTLLCGQAAALGWGPAVWALGDRQDPPS